MRSYVAESRRQIGLTMKRFSNPTDPAHQRGVQARENLANALRECGELADAVESFDGQELIEVLDYLDSLRFVMAESGQLLAGVVRGEMP
jgi:NTP pyrophosphatase (non-canonical NTP hydrolase)